MKLNGPNEGINREKLEKTEVRQEEKMAALGQLAGGIAHDFNNYLMSIIGNATMIQKTDDIDRINDYAERIIRISQNAASLTKKILMFSKKESSINKPINLKCILNNIYNMIEVILCNEMELIYNYDANHEIILGDESQLESMIINILINARDAMRKKFGKSEIGTMDIVIDREKVLSHGEIITPGQYIKIYVEDNGPGMDEETLQKAFEPYFTTKNKSNGTGLGLSVVFGTVKLHSGYINVESKIGYGTRFEIYIPVFNPDDSSHEKGIKGAGGDIVMLVDDDINVLDIESEMLEDLGYDIVKFTNPKDALEYYTRESKNISFSLIDLMMPEISGRELFEKMKIINKDAAVIFITGYANQAEYEELEKRGVKIIEKPFTYEELSKEIAHMYT